MSQDPNISNQSCAVQIFDSDNKLIYEVDINLSSSIQDLKLSLHTQSLIDIPPSEQEILFNTKECNNTTTFQQLYTQNNNQSPIKLHVVQAVTDPSSA